MVTPTRGRLPDPPEGYDVAYMRRLVASLEHTIAELQTTGHVLGTTANFSQLPTSSVGLRAGDLWNDAGTVKIV